MGKYSFLKAPNELIVTLEGKFDENDSYDLFINDFKTAIKNCLYTDTTLVLHLKKLQLFSKDDTWAVKQGFSEFENYKFKKIDIYIDKKSILSKQAQRLAREAGLSNYEILG